MKEKNHLDSKTKLVVSTLDLVAESSKKIVEENELTPHNMQHSSSNLTNVEPFREKTTSAIEVQSQDREVEQFDLSAKVSKTAFIAGPPRWGGAGTPGPMEFREPMGFRGFRELTRKNPSNLVKTFFLEIT